MAEVIFSTIHGSHLYGMAHSDSDLDTYTVTTSARRKARHTVNEETGEDAVRIGWGTFLVQCHEGSHQALEALFSPYKQWNESFIHLKPMIESYRVGGADVFAKYERTIRAFCHRDDFKSRCHAVRLALNLVGMRLRGRFNPALDEAVIPVIEAYAQRNGDELERLLLG